MAMRLPFQLRRSLGLAEDSADSSLASMWPRRGGRAGSANVVFLGAALLVGGSLLGVLGFRFPGEASRWVQNQGEIRELQEVNANLRKLEAERLERLKVIEENFDGPGLEIRRRYHLYKPEEKIFILPSAKPDSPDAASSLPAVPTPATP